MSARTIVFLGDSITDCHHLWEEGPEPHLGSGYVNFIGEEYGSESLRFVNSGHDGFTAWNIARFLEEDCLRYHPFSVSLLVGVNDLCAYRTGAGGYPPEEYGFWMREIVSRLRAESAIESICVMEPFIFPEPAEYRNWQRDLDAFSSEARRATAGERTVWIPLDSFWKRQIARHSCAELSPDGVHLTKLGHFLLAKEWLRVFRGVTHGEYFNQTQGGT